MANGRGTSGVAVGWRVPDAVLRGASVLSRGRGWRPWARSWRAWRGVVGRLGRSARRAAGVGRLLVRPVGQDEVGGSRGSGARVAGAALSRGSRGGALRLARWLGPSGS
jgi:hypothetical protein